MKCTNKRKNNCIFGILLVAILLTGCNESTYILPYNPNIDQTSMRISVRDTFEREDPYARATPFSNQLCVILGDFIDDNPISDTDVTSMGLFHVTNGEVLYADNLFQEMSVASLTKVMTALLALEAIERGDISLSDTIVVVQEAIMTDSTAQSCDFEVGDQVTLNQALYALLIYSACDAANLIGIHVAGDLDSFYEMMNARALQLGATHTNYANAHGMPQDNHFSTPYDQYLIFQEALKFPKFIEIIRTEEFTTKYRDRNDVDQELKLVTTNMYLREEYEAPTQITVIGGKTGTTLAAGNCNIIYVQDSSGNSYIVLVMGAIDRQTLYDRLSKLLDKI